MIAVELVEPGTSDARPGAGQGASPRRRTSEGVIVLTCGTYGNVLRFLPPLSITDDLLHEALRRPRRDLRRTTPVTAA